MGNPFEFLLGLQASFSPRCRISYIRGKDLSTKYGRVLLNNKDTKLIPACFHRYAACDYGGVSAVIDDALTGQLSPIPSRQMSPPPIDCLYVITDGRRQDVLHRALKYQNQVKNIYIVTGVDINRDFLSPVELISHNPNTSDLLSINHPYYIEISRKRNAYLKHSFKFHYRTIVIMDDDIDDARNAMFNARGHLQSGADIASAYSLFHPDISAIDCIRSKITQEPARISISGNFLVMNVEKIRNQFTPIYNEDWVFLSQGLFSGLRIVGCGIVNQIFCKKLSLKDIEIQVEGDLLADIIREDPINGLSQIKLWREMKQQRCMCAQRKYDEYDSNPFTE